MNFRDYYLWAGMILLCLSHGRRRKYLPNPDVRVTMQADKDTKNAPRLSREIVSGKGRGAF